MLQVRILLGAPGKYCMNYYHFNINLPVAFIPYEKDIYNSFQELPVKRYLINKEFIDWLNSIGLSFYNMRFFNSPPYANYNLHIDGPTSNNCVKLNLIFNSTDTIMNWYEPLEGYQGEIIDNSLGEKILKFDKEKCKVVYSTEVNQCCILNGNVIHDLKNGPNNRMNRHCYSFFLTKLENNERLSWNEAEVYFQPFRV